MNFYLALLLLWALVALPAPLAHLLLLDKVPEARVLVGFGIASLTNAVLWLSQSTKLSKRMLLTALFFWIGILTYAGAVIHRQQSDLKVAALVLILLVQGFLIWSYLSRKRFFLPALALLSFVATLWFNPWVRGGDKALRQNPVSQALIESSKPDSIWAVQGSTPMGNLPRALGLKSFAGAYFYPPLSIWRKLDPEGRFENAYNRFQHLSMNFQVPYGSLSISNPDTDQARLEINADDERFLALGVNRLLVEGSDLSHDLRRWKLIRELGRFHIYARRPEPQF
jgi:hypothetical protein